MFLKLKVFLVSALFSLTLISCHENKSNNDKTSQQTNKPPQKEFFDISELACDLDHQKNSKNIDTNAAVNWTNDNLVLNNTLHRGFVIGTVVPYNKVDLISTNTGTVEFKWNHERFMLQLEPTGSTKAFKYIEIVHEPKFGAVTSIVKMGDKVVVCGDYIKSTAPTTKAGKTFQPSAAGAIMHFTHAVCGTSHHAEGYVALPATLNGKSGYKIYGNDHSVCP